MKLKLQVKLNGLPKALFWACLFQWMAFSPVFALEASSKPDQNVLPDVTVSGTVTDINGEPLPGGRFPFPEPAGGRPLDPVDRIGVAALEVPVLVFCFMGLGHNTTADGR